MPADSLSTRLRRLVAEHMARHSLTRQQLALRANVAYSTFHVWLHGEGDLRTETAEKIARAIGVSIRLELEKEQQR